MTAAQLDPRDLRRSLASRLCPLCGGRKGRAKTVCFRCWRGGGAQRLCQPALRAAHARRLARDALAGIVCGHAPQLSRPALDAPGGVPVAEPTLSRHARRGAETLFVTASRSSPARRSSRPHRSPDARSARDFGIITRDSGLSPRQATPRTTHAQVTYTTGVAPFYPNTDRPGIVARNPGFRRSQRRLPYLPIQP